MGTGDSIPHNVGSILIIIKKSPFVYMWQLVSNIHPSNKKQAATAPHFWTVIDSREQPKADQSHGLLGKVVGSFDIRSSAEKARTPHQRVIETRREMRKGEWLSHQEWSGATHHSGAKPEFRHRNLVRRSSLLLAWL
jgi:hypothetical protein